MNVYDVLMDYEYKEIAIAVLLQHGFSSFEEVGDNDDQTGFRIWTGPELSPPQIQSWFPISVRVIAHQKTETYSVDVTEYSDHFRLVNTPTQVRGNADICLVSGAGFGWGEHETTQMGLNYLWRFYPNKLDKKRILDFGAGTGILGLAAQCCGAELVHAIEIDDGAIHTLKLNISANRGSTQFECHRQLAQRTTTYDFILANVYLDVLMNVVPDLCTRLEPAGKLWVSGFPFEQRHPIIELAEHCACKVIEMTQIRSWGSAVFARQDT